MNEKRRREKGSVEDGNKINEKWKDEWWITCKWEEGMRVKGR